MSSEKKQPQRFTFLGERISQEEHEFLEELRYEETVTRMIPASISSATAVYILSRKGYIKQFERFGAWPKTIIGAGLGLALGKVAYLTTKCQRIVEEMPNSTLAYVVRRQLGNDRIFALSQEEALLSLQCKKDAFYYRALPLGALFSGLTVYLIKIGEISAHSRFGIWPPTFSAGILGYYAGMVLYRSTRMERFITELPNSQVAKEYRRDFGPKMTDAEILMFSQCLTDSFKYRSLPLMALFTSGIITMYRKGKFRGKYGHWPWTLSAMVIGLALGFVSSSYFCAQKFIKELPDSESAKKFAK